MAVAAGTDALVELSNVSWKIQAMKRYSEFVNEGYHDPEKTKKHSNASDHELAHHAKQFDEHAKSVARNRLRHAALATYKNRGHEEINHKLRNDEGHSQYNLNNVHHLDKITSHKTEHDMYLYRGLDHSDTHQLHKLKPGDRFHDDGYTSTSMRHDSAARFAKPHKGEDGKVRKHILKIHAPAGTMGHHTDNEHNRTRKRGNEHEVLLHRGTHFEVTHHSQAGSHHYTHVKVVGHEPKPLADFKRADRGKYHQPGTDINDHEAEHLRRHEGMSDPIKGREEYKGGK